MTKNPYQSPRAQLEREVIVSARPGVVSAAIWLMAASFAIRFVSILLEDGLPNSPRLRRWIAVLPCLDYAAGADATDPAQLDTVADCHDHRTWAFFHALVGRSTFQ